jgi:hypothetical protein
MFWLPYGIEVVPLSEDDSEDTQDLSEPLEAPLRAGEFMEAAPTSPRWLTTWRWRVGSRRTRRLAVP